MGLLTTTNLTPIEKRGDYYFKREDYYKPYDFSPVNGSKLRQCQLLVGKNFDAAKKGIVTGTSVLSPQATIVSSVGRELGIPVYIFYGGTRMELLRKKKYPMLCIELGANVSIVSSVAYTNVLQHKASEFAKSNDCFDIKYGFDLMNNTDVFIESVATQTKNIPTNVENIIITIGSAITLLGVLFGISKYAKHIKKIYGIGCAPTRIDKIRKYSNIIKLMDGVNLPIHKLIYVDAFNQLKGFKYENTKKIEYEGIKFHPRYEAKAFSWLLDNSNSFDGGKTLFWITGSDI